MTRSRTASVQASGRQRPARWRRSTDRRRSSLPWDGRAHWGRRAAQGAVLALGAPLGWLLIRSAAGTSFRIELVSHPGLYLYLTVATILVFGFFGALLGRIEDRLTVSRAVLYTLSISDSLTGLRNTHYFWGRLQEEYADVVRRGEPAAVLIVDLDHFKEVNDQHGHLVGDRVLAASAQAIASAVRGADTAARMNQTAARVGGEEFGILLPATDLDGAHTVAERIRAEVGSARIPLREGGEVGITASIGVAGILGEIPGAEQAWFAAADEAMYRAKRAGRNRVVSTLAGVDADHSLRTVG